MTIVVYVVRSLNWTRINAGYPLIQFRQWFNFVTNVSPYIVSLHYKDNRVLWYLLDTLYIDYAYFPPLRWTMESMPFYNICVRYFECDCTLCKTTRAFFSFFFFDTSIMRYCDVINRESCIHVCTVCVALVANSRYRGSYQPWFLYESKPKQEIYTTH